MIETGLVEMKASTTLSEVNDLIKNRQAYWDKEDSEYIDWQIEESAKSRWWRFVKGKNITADEAIKILNKNSGWFGWRCLEGSDQMNGWKMIRNMCNASLETHQNQPKSVYLSGKQINGMR